MCRALVFCFLFLCSTLCGDWPAVSNAAWGSGGCCSVEQPGVTSSGFWKQDQDGFQYHSEDGHLTAARNPQTGEQWTAVDGRWQKCCQCSEQCKCGCCCSCQEGKRCSDQCSCSKKAEAQEKIPNFGVDKSRLSDEESYTINGEKVSRSQARAALKAPEIPDDSGFLRLTIGSDDPIIRAQVEKDLQTAVELSQWKNRLVFNSVPLNSWIAKRLQMDSGTTISIQSPDGQELERQNDYQDGAYGLAINLRSAERKFDPKKTPDDRQDALSVLLAQLKEHLPVDPILLALVGVGGWVWWKGRDQ